VGAISALAARGAKIRWLALYQAARWIYDHGRQAWENLEPRERQRLGELVRKSKGRRANLTDREREELWSLVKKTATGR
jgi:hypothetical protein